jgi:uncharacterized protein (DUF1697 family)
VHWVALLRGINVGGKNLIKMTALKSCLEEHGFSDVATYIQSGNVVFAATGRAAELTKRMERALSSTFGADIAVVVKSHKQLQTIVDDAPKGFGREPATYRYDVLFLKEPLTAKQALAKVPTREGVDEVSAGKGVLYFSRLISKATESKLSRVVSMPIYKSMTIRNWNTTTKLLALIT